MRFDYKPKAKKQFLKLHHFHKKQFAKQLSLLLKDIRHPSLHAKKYDESLSIWQARINDDFRFYFQIIDDIYVILAIVKHPK